MVIPPPQLKVYGADPPVGVKLIAPVEPPLHAIFVTTVVPEIAVGWVIVAVAVVKHPRKSVTVTV